jgi:hypothetical protein
MAHEAKIECYLQAEKRHGVYMQRCPQNSEGTYTCMVLALFEKTFAGNCGTNYNTHGNIR